ncbi:hypothetical protein [Anaerorhabdus sp.]|uniref:DUF6973 domain-containing protein n=1 Tax=Anaerorhabdus sp. TaxID=1872524 RepID=UPI002B20BA36|nr:hypothetical protein [Anaerorhabdus sp.]MEA4873998.1 hypothetical protein [Anaerorhabdus sp.]
MKKRNILGKFITMLIIPALLFASSSPIFAEEERIEIPNEVLESLNAMDYSNAYYIAENAGVYDSNMSEIELQNYFVKLYIDIYESTRNVDTRGYLPESVYDLNAEEKKLVGSHPDEAAIVYMCSSLAIKATIAEYGDNRGDDNSDAFRHTFWNAVMTTQFGGRSQPFNVTGGRNRANVWATAHEAESSGLSKTMDLFNNNLGRMSITRKMSTNEIQSMIRSKIKNGSAKIIVNGKLVASND